MTATVRCPLCGAARLVSLPDPGPRTMASDLRIVDAPLGKMACGACGLAMRAAGDAGLDRLYGDGYGLYAHAPGAPVERARQQRYAAWIAGALAAPPRRVLDVGCGNGSLLLALGEAWPGAGLSGCDASADSVAHGRAAGLRLWQSTSAALAPAQADLVVSVNVIEHTVDPAAFIADLRRACTPGGTVIVVCPDGSRAGVELLFADHLFSLTSDHLRRLAVAAGLTPRSTAGAPEALGEFQMLVASVDGAEPSVLPPLPDPANLNARRSSMLRRWGLVDGQLSARLPAEVVCFGTGEAAGLLRAYAPVAWSRVRACTADGAVAGRWADLPVLPLEEVARDTTMLLGVRPADQPAVAARLGLRFDAVATWYDLVLE